MSRHHHYHPLPPTTTHYTRNMEPSYKPCGNPNRPSALRIEVPENSAPDTAATLQDAIALESTPSPGFHYRQIAQLPTPVANTGRFPPGTLDMPKRGSRSSGNRVVSEFQRPKASPLLPPQVRMRHLSNPTADGAADGALPPFPLPPHEPPALPYHGRVFVAPHTGHQYRYEQQVGTGAFSTVVAARNTHEPHELVAVKLVAVPTDDARTVASFRRYICRELGILRAVEHPGVVRLLDYSVTLLISEQQIDDSFRDGADTPPAGSEMYDFYTAKVANEQCFFLRYLRGGSLFAWLQRNYACAAHTGFWRLMRRVVAEVVVTTAFLHHHLVIHRDIKPENVLLAADYNVADYDGASAADAMAAVAGDADAVATLTDFGLSRRLALPSQLLLTKCGSHDYVSPELLMGLNYDGRLLDLWALGVLAYCILEDRLPFDAPPLEFVHTSAVSLSVLKRRQSRNGPAYRIATIDWDWYRAAELQKNTAVSAEANAIIASLMKLVEVLLVRKDRRVTPEALLERDGFEWITAEVPLSFLAWRRQ